MDPLLPESVGGFASIPSPLTSSQGELCRRLDELHARYGLITRPSDMFRGAIFTARLESRANPDWMAQAAHSLRDILYPFGKEGVPNREKALKEFGSVHTDGKFTGEVGRIFGSLTELAHHGNCSGDSVDFVAFKATDFDKLFVDFERTMLDALARQGDVHDEIDSVLEENPQ